MSLKEFIDMGGYGAYVWSSYGIAAVVMAYQWIAPVLAHRRNKASLKRLLRRKENQS